MKRSLDCGAASAKKSRIQQSFRDSYSMEWPFYVASKVSKNHAFCKICGCDFSIAHGGRDDCRRHALSKKHNDYGKLNCQTLDKHFGIKNDDPMRAELLFTSYIIEHNLPIAAADHSKGLLQEIDPESKVAQKFTCGRTKAAALVKFLGESTEHRILAVIQQKAFALATDGSSDANDKKLYPLVVTYFNNEKGRNSTVLLSILDTADNTGKGIFTAIDGYLKRKNVPWKNCISFSCDNASTMIGNIKGVTKFITEVQPSLIVIKCACHLIHIAAKKASYQLQNFDVEQMIIQIFFYLEKSSKRKKLLKVSQNFFETKPHKILKHIGTRWLSLQQSIDRILEQWDALEHFFKSLNSEKESNSQLKNIQFMMSNPLAKLYCLFLSSSLPIFTGVNKDLQQEAPLIHKLKRKLNNLLFVLIVRFLKPCAITDSNLSDIKFEKRKNQKDDSDLVIGAKTRAYMKDVVLSKSDISVFYTSVRNFYVTACNYIVKKFPLNDTFLTHAEAADIDLRKTVSFSSINYLASLFNYGTEALDELEQEFSLYQTDVFNFDVSRMDECWNSISLIKNEQGLLKYPSLAKLMTSVLIVSHSNAPTERVFSIVRKNITIFRPNLSVSTLSSLMVEKVKNLSDGEVCYEKKLSKADIESAKKATKLSVTVQKK